MPKTARARFAAAARRRGPHGISPVCCVRKSPSCSQSATATAAAPAAQRIQGRGSVPMAPPMRGRGAGEMN